MGIPAREERVSIWGTLARLARVQRVVWVWGSDSFWVTLFRSVLAISIPPLSLALPLPAFADKRDARGLLLPNRLAMSPRGDNGDEEPDESFDVRCCDCNKDAKGELEPELSISAKLGM
eukprot:CAMPEP_0194423554 /NCGR_PEP_ID=MMETSP0176-20130528/22772_1 /TAXON_ID=216777 /ORGANISM="Proboscia alata, Strain PI-D3" /LENGTH=118 /DNA_ID=CAMNT_0039232805 /DNA_START=378 /DNA_END=731 /DNA_ORIENTATION=+